MRCRKVWRKNLRREFLKGAPLISPWGGGGGLQTTSQRVLVFCPQSLKVYRRDGAGRPWMAIEAVKTAREIAAECRALEDRATKANLHFLAYLLNVAGEEATARANDQRGGIQ